MENQPRTEPSEPAQHGEPRPVSDAGGCRRCGWRMERGPFATDTPPPECDRSQCELFGPPESRS